MLSQKKKSLLKENIAQRSYIYYLVPFLLFSAVMVVLILAGHNFAADAYYIGPYLFTYRHGFMARGFIGELISWFVEIVTPRVTAAAVIIGSFLFIIAVSFCIGFVLNKVKNDKKLFWLVFWLIVILCLSPFTFRNYLTSVKTEKFVWAISLFMMPLIAHKKLIWFVPPLCVLAVVVNAQFLFTSMVLVAILLLQKLYDEKYSAKMKAVCILSFSLIIIAFLLTALSEKRLGFTNAEEMVYYYFDRYRDANGNSIISNEMVRSYSEFLFQEFFSTLPEIIAYNYRYFLTDSGSISGIVLQLVLYILPIYLCIGAFWVVCFKKAKEKFQKFIFLLCILAPFIALPMSVVSWEISKYFSNNVFVQMCLIIAMLAGRNPAVMAAVGQIRGVVQKNRALFAVVCAYLTLLLVR